MDRVGKGRARHRLRAGADGLDHQAPLKLAQNPPGRRFKLNGHRTDKICSFNAAPRGGEGKYENETHHANRLRPAERVREFLCLKPPWFLMPSPSSARSRASRTRSPSATSLTPRSCSLAFRSAAITWRRGWRKFLPASGTTPCPLESSTRRCTATTWINAWRRLCIQRIYRST